MIFAWLIVTILGSTMLLWNQSFVQLWVGAEYYVGTISDLLIILMVSQFALFRKDANIIDLTLDLRKKVLIGLLSAVFTAGASGILEGVYKMGMVG